MLRLPRSLARLVRDLARLRNCAAGVSAVEFAIVMPALVAVLLGTVEGGRYVMHARNLNLTVNGIAQMASQADGTLTASDAQFIRDSAMLSFPDALTEAGELGIEWTDHLKIGISGIEFTQRPDTCATGPCQYFADTRWTAGHTAARKACGRISSAHPDASPSTTTLPYNTFGPHEVIAVVASVDYVPLFGSTVFPSLTLTRGAYFLPRTAAKIDYSPAGNSTFGTVCPGF
ncbi:MAG: pilus assembly protein [Hyphomicrobiales bacterium]|nr:pilus assembly protein [Hyphomicrobiales bacterium]